MLIKNCFTNNSSTITSHMWKNTRYPLFPPTVPGAVGGSPARRRGTIGERGTVEEKRG
jgi:hypothetical protein